MRTTCCSNEVQGRRLSDGAEKTVLISALDTFSLLIDAQRPVVFINQDRYMPSRLGILIDQHLDGHRCDGCVQGLDRWFFDLLPCHISPLHQCFSDRCIGMPFAGNLDWVDAIEAL